MASSTARAIDCLRAAERAGADAVAVTPPHYYASRGPDDQLAHYRACIAAASGPVVVYNIPSTTKVALAPETLARLAALEGVVAIKDSSADLMHFLRVLDLLPEGRRCAVLIGSPPLAGAAILYGGDGAVPGTANIDPTTLVAVYEAARRRDLEQLRVLQRRVHRLGDLVIFGAPVVCIKTALELMGVCAAHATAPFQPLGPEQRDALRARLVELELLPA
jgi:4-hydroxy-tetrahydrodipicolinate synthase